MPAQYSRRDRMRTAKLNSGLALHPHEKAARSNHRSTRRNQDLSAILAIDAYIAPQVPKELWNGLKRPSWIDVDEIWNSKGKKGTARCCVKNCDQIADSLDHIVDWRTYIEKNCDWMTVKVKGGTWEGYLKEDVSAAYSDARNLQLMCTAHNSKKSGKTHAALDRPVFTRS